MIGWLKGTVIERDDEEAIIDVGGVGYVVRCGVRALAEIAGDTTLSLWIESQTREDGTKLYGFLNKDDRASFRALISVQGVGPKAALAVLDVLTPDALARCVANEDKTSVSRASGVGPKLAQRIVIELKGKQLFAGGAFLAPKEATAAMSATSQDVTMRNDVIAALLGLGISESIAHNCFQLASSEAPIGADLATMIRLSLKKAAR